MLNNAMIVEKYSLLLITFFLPLHKICAKIKYETSHPDNQR